MQKYESTRSRVQEIREYEVIAYPNSVCVAQESNPTTKDSDIRNGLHFSVSSLFQCGLPPQSRHPMIILACSPSAMIHFNSCFRELGCVVREDTCHLQSLDKTVRIEVENLKTGYVCDGVIMVMGDVNRN